MLRDRTRRVRSALGHLALLPLVIAMVGCGNDDTEERTQSTCEQWYEYFDRSCTEAPIDVAETCQALDTLESHSGCVSQYDALFSCIAEHKNEWTCELPACADAASAVNDCVDPYCSQSQHADECQSPF